MTDGAHTIEPAKPCPFCGSEDVQYERSEPVGDPPATWFWIACKKCDATGPSTTRMADGLRLWNGRMP